MKPHNPSRHRRPLRLERCEARRVLSAEGLAPLLGEALDSLPDYVQADRSYGWTEIDANTSLASIDYAGTATASLIFNLSADSSSTRLEGLQGSFVNSQRLLDDSALSRAWDLAIANGLVVRGDGLQDGVSDLGGEFPFELLPDPDGAGSLELDPFNPDGELLASSEKDAGSSQPGASFGDEASSERSDLAPPALLTPLERARSAVAPLERVSFAAAQAGESAIAEAGMIDLLAVLDTPTDDQTAADPVADDSLRVAARDAALAVESWARSLPAPADAALADADTPPAPGRSPVEARSHRVDPLGEGPLSPPAPAKAEVRPSAATDRVSSDPGPNRVTADLPAPSAEALRWEERVAGPYGFLAGTLTTLLGGAVWATRRAAPRSDQGGCVELPRRAPRG